MQVHSFKKKGLAESVLRSYRPFDNRPLFIQEVPFGENQTWYKVCIGEFQERTLAKDYEQLYREKTGDKDTMIATILN